MFYNCFSSKKTTYFLLTLRSDIEQYLHFLKDCFRCGYKSLQIQHEEIISSLHEKNKYNIIYNDK